MTLKIRSINEKYPTRHPTPPQFRINRVYNFAARSPAPTYRTIDHRFQNSLARATICDHCADTMAGTSRA